MSKAEVLKKLRTELDSPHLTLPLEEKDYTEEEYTTLKQSLHDYFEEYVRKVEN